MILHINEMFRLSTLDWSAWMLLWSNDSELRGLRCCLFASGTTGWGVKKKHVIQFYDFFLSQCQQADVKCSRLLSADWQIIDVKNWTNSQVAASDGHMPGAHYKSNTIKEVKNRVLCQSCSKRIKHSKKKGNFEGWETSRLLVIKMHRAKEPEAKK